MGGNLELSRGISKGVCACLGGGTLTRLALDPDGAEGLSLQPGRVHTPPSHDLRSKKINHHHQSQEKSIFSPVLTASYEKRDQFQLPGNT